MRNLSLILAILCFAACKQDETPSSKKLYPDNSKLVTLKLIDSLGFITCSIPNLYDTFFHWTNRSDCGKPCEHEEYRFQPRNVNITKESGFICNCEPKDSVERFTIRHSGWFEFRDSTDSNYIKKYHSVKKEGLMNDPATHNRIKSDTIEKINDRYFSIVIIDGYISETSQYLKKVLSSTTIRSNKIDFNYELLTKKKDSITDHFIENSIRLIRTIEISNGI